MGWKAEIDAAAKRTNGHLVKTPVLTVNGFGLSYPVQMKLEQLQHTGSFKARGAFNTLLSLPVPKAGLVAVSFPVSESRSSSMQLAHNPTSSRLATLGASSRPKSEAPSRNISGLCSRIKSQIVEVNKST